MQVELNFTAYNEIFWHAMHFRVASHGKSTLSLHEFLYQRSAGVRVGHSHSLSSIAGETPRVDNIPTRGSGKSNDERVEGLGKGQRGPRRHESSQVLYTRDAACSKHAAEMFLATTLCRLPSETSAWTHHR